VRGKTLVRALAAALVAGLFIGATTIARADSAPPSASFDQSSITVDPAGGSDTTHVSVQIDLNAPAPSAVTLDWSRSDGGSGTVPLQAGDQNATFDLAVSGDGGTSFTVTLSSEDTSVVTVDQGTLTVTVNPLRTLSANDATADAPGIGQSAPASVTVSLDAPTSQTVTAQWTLTGGNASAGFDYPSGGESGTVTIQPNSTSATIPLTVMGNGGVYFFVQLSGVAHANVGNATAKVTINPVPLISVAAATTRAPAVQGGTRHVEIPVSLSRPTSLTVTVNWSISSASAPSGKLTFAPGATSASIPYDATTADGGKSLAVTLSNPTNARLATGGASAFLTVLTLPKVSVGDASIGAPGVGKQAYVNVPVTLDQPTGDTVTVAWALADASARAGTDYVAAAGNLTFAPGATSETITAQVTGNGGDSFDVVLSNPTAATLGDATGIVTITGAGQPPNPGGGGGSGGNPPPPTLPTLSIGDAVVSPPASSTSSASAAVTVTLSAPSTKTVTVAYATRNGTATAGTDYTAASGTLTFAPGGATTQTIQVPITGGNGKSFFVDLSSPTNATLTQPAGNASQTVGEATVTITSAATLSINDVSLLESNGPAVLTVTLTGSPAGQVTVDYATVPGTATSPGSFTASQGTLTFPPGTTTEPISIPIVNDNIANGKRIFTVSLSNPKGAAIAKAIGQVTINDDDDTIQTGSGGVTIGDVKLPGGRGPTIPAGGSVAGGGNGSNGSSSSNGSSGPSKSNGGSQSGGGKSTSATPTSVSANALLKLSVVSLNLGTGSILHLRLSCASTATAACSGVVTLSLRPKAARIAKSSFTIAKGRTKTVSLRLAGTALTTLKRKSSLKAYVNVTGKSGAAPLTTALTVVLRSHRASSSGGVTIKVPGT